MLELQEKVFYSEYAAGIYQLGQTILTYLFSDRLMKSSRLSMLGGFGTLFLQKHFREGLRVNSLLLLLTEALLLLKQTKAVNIPYWGLLGSIGMYLFSIKKLKVYKFPKPRGSYPVGYIHRVENGKLSTLSETQQTQDLVYSVYYPCVDSGQHLDSRWMEPEEYWRRMHDTNMKDKERPGKVPRLFFKIQSQYLYKIQMGVLEGANLLPISELVYKPQFTEQSSDVTEQTKGLKKLDKFPVVIISHGLAAHCNAYTLFAKELASNGYIVFSLDHDEEIKNPYVDREENRLFRRKQLLRRLEATQKMLDLIHNQQYMIELFGDKKTTSEILSEKEQQSIPIDYEKLSILGHSFGGSTALYTAMNDQRITGAVIGLDPCIYVFDKEETDLCAFPRPLLCINSENFYRRLYPWFENDERIEDMFSKIDERFKDISVNCAIKRSAHANQSDLALVMAGEFDLFGITTRGECAKKHMFYNLMLLEHYLERYVICRDQETQQNKQEFLQKYFQSIGNNHQDEYIFYEPTTF